MLLRTNDVFIWSSRQQWVRFFCELDIVWTSVCYGTVLYGKVRVCIPKPLRIANFLLKQGRHLRSVDDSSQSSATEVQIQSDK